MKVAISAVVMAVAGFVSGQNFNGEPSCAIPCLTSAISVAGCALTDQACQCGSAQAAIKTAITPCLLSACSPGDLNSAASAGYALCSAYSLTSASIANATTTATTLGSISASNTVIVISTPAATTSTTTSASGSAITTTTSMKSSSAGTGTGTGTSSTASAASSSSTAGAERMQVLGAGVGGLVGILGAVVAAL